MEGADSGAPASDSGNGLTTTQSGIPIAPVYAGAGVLYNFSGMTRSRRAEFRESQKYRQRDYGTEYRNPYVPTPRGPRGGIDISKNMAGTGELYDDPLDGFRSESLNIDRRPTPIRRPSRPQDSSRQRRKSTSIYRKANPSNEDYGRNM